MPNLNQTPSGERVTIGLFGRRNAGKSALINALTGQSLAIVSDVAGTTTDPVSKAMELLPLGPVTVIDTPGLDDEGELGRMRVERTYGVLNRTDIAVIVIDATRGMGEWEEKLLALIREKGIPHVIAWNQSDREGAAPPVEGAIAVSALRGDGIEELRGAIASFTDNGKVRRIISDLVQSNDIVVLVTPIDSAAPKGRLILPQQQTIRDLLDGGAMPLVCRETELSAALSSLAGPPRMVVTDSQAFGYVAGIVGPQIPLTSFSMLMARYKGNFADAVAGARAIDSLKPGDRVLISEGCSHRRQCGDIGSVKLPNWLKKKVGGELSFTFTSGGDFPQDFDGFRLVIHCGGCMLTEREMLHRYKTAKAAGIPITNYGVAIAHLHGILDRAAAPLL